ncbi:MAG: hypothetical protein ACOCYE_13750, partial [Pseudomonadota bacterium]
PQSSSVASRRYVLPLLLLLAGCAADPAPEGGARPDFADVPERPAPLLAPAERRAVMDNLQVDRAESRAASGVVAARLGRIEAAPPAASLPPAPITGVPRPPLPEPVIPPLIGDDLMEADGLVELAEAASRDRVLLERRLELGDPPPPPPPAPIVVTAVVFAPDGRALVPLERARLANALALAGSGGRWDVVVHGDPALVEPRGRAIVEALAEDGLEVPDIAVLAGDRPVDLAEVRIRR